MRHKYRYLPLHLASFIALFAAFIFLIGGSKGAGQTVQVDRAQLERSQTGSPFGPGVSPEGTVDDHVVASPNDADLGEQEVLKRAEQYEPWTLSVSSPIFYTSNVALTNSGEQHDIITAPAAGVFYQPRITKTLYGLIDVRQQFFYYDRFNAFDFGSMDVEAGLSYIIPQFHNLLLRGEYDFNRLTFSDRVLDEFFENHSIILNAEVPFRFSRAHQLLLGVDANISVGADHQAPRRNDYEAYASYSVFLTRSLSIDSVGRVVVRDYYRGNRTDVSEILAVSANLRLTKWWTVSAISSFARSDSNHEVFDYSVANVGAAMALTAKF
jgi:hypothetical protein